LDPRQFLLEESWDKVALGCIEPKELNFSYEKMGLDDQNHRNNTFESEEHQ
jgi:hypothetical protein